MSAKKTEKGESFWTTLPGILTAITGLIVAVTGLVTVLGYEGVLRSLGISRLGTETPTAPISTPGDQDDPNVTPDPAIPTRHPDAPDCTASLSYEKPMENSDDVILAWSEDELWVRYSELEDDIFSREDVTARRFPQVYKATDCLAEYIKNFSIVRQVHWPVAESSNGRTYSKVWFNNNVTIDPHPLNDFPVKPEMVLVYVIDGDELYMQIYHCATDIPSEILGKVYHWYAGTDEAALLELLETQFDTREQRPTVTCE